MVIFQTLFGLTDPQLLFDIVLHLGTLVATVIVFHKEIIKLFLSPRAILLLIAATIPTAVIGLTLSDFIELRAWNMRFACIGLIFTGLLLYFSQYINEKPIRVEGPLFSYISIGQAFLIGIAQGIAIFPGISRSGITIVTALFLGTGRKEAATFSFLLSLPSILGALVLKIYKTPNLPLDQISQFSTGFFLSLLIGTVSLFVLVKIVLKGQFYKFSYYCMTVGIIGLIVNYNFL